MPGFEWFGEEERKQVNEVLDTGVLFRYGFDQARKGRWKAREFEEELAKRLKQGSGYDDVYCHLCASGTAALGVALAACGVGAGDEVLIPPFTFVATIEAVLTAGAVPVFVEIDETLCMSPDEIEPAITPRTKAVIPVHMCGSMARIDKIKTICEKNELILIEDACQSMGATFNGRALGTFGRVGCFSFDPVKTVTCGEGGAMITTDKDAYLTADQYSDHGHDHIGDDRGLEDHIIVGTNYRISELNAAVGLAQLRKLDNMLAKQREHKNRIKQALKRFPEITFREIPDEAGDSATFLSFFLPDEAKAKETITALGKAGVDGCFYWYDNNWHYIRKWDHIKNMISAAKLPQAFFDNKREYSSLNMPKSDSIMKRTISMQIKLSWTPEELTKRIEAMVGVFEG